MTAEPYTDAATHVRDELRRAWLRLEYQIRMGWRYECGVAENVPIREEMLRLFSTSSGTESAADTSADRVLEQWLAEHQRIQARIDATIAAHRRSPLVDVIRNFGLSERQWSTLAFALLPEIDPNLVYGYRHLARDRECRGLDGHLLSRLVYDTPSTRSIMARDLSGSSPLLRFGLIDVGRGSSPSESLMFRRIRATPRLVHLLDDAWLDIDPELTDVAELRPASGTGAFPRVVVERAISAVRSTNVILVVQGQRGVGKKLLLQRAAAHWNQRILTIDALRLSLLPTPMQQAVVRALVRELTLLDAVPAFTDIDDAISDTDRDALPACFGLFVREWSGPVALTISRERLPRIPQRPIVHVTLEVPPHAIRAEMWQHAVPSLTTEDADALAGRFAIPGGVIAAAAQAAEAERMPEAGPPSASDLDKAVATQLHQRISRLGKKLATPFELDDLIVDDDTRTALVEIAAAARERHKIRDHFSLRGAQGLSVLFSGHPGVGKTMSATVLARRLGLEIYEIDLSQVVSKWLGETEKNLSDVFDAAEPGHVVLLFNEADSLFGKRTSDVQSSNDRYANLETNYLLQRLERFNGLAILTTNLTGAIDQAFKRRFTYDIYFAFPSREMRAELWRRTLPERARSAEIDFGALAEDYELTGGFIKVACERAAYIAGATSSDIDEQLLRATVARMYRERGKLSTMGPLE